MTVSPAPTPQAPTVESLRADLRAGRLTAQELIREAHRALPLAEAARVLAVLLRREARP